VGGNCFVLISKLAWFILFRAGADLKEECSVETATLDRKLGVWTITLHNDERTFKSRVGS